MNKLMAAPITHDGGSEFHREPPQKAESRLILMLEKADELYS